MVDTTCLLAFLRRTPGSNTFVVSEIEDFKTNIGCPPGELLPYLLRDSGLHLHIPALLTRLRAFPAEVVHFVNIAAAAPLVTGEAKITGSACSELFGTMAAFPASLEGEREAVAAFTAFVAQSVSSSSIELSEAAGKLFFQLARGHPREGVHPVAILVAAARQHLGDSTLELRYGSVVCSVAGAGEDLFSACLEEGAVDIVMQLCRTPDELVQIVALETVEQLFNTEGGLRYMISAGHVQWMVQEACGQEPVLASYALRVAAAFFVRLAAASAQQGSHGLLQQVWGDQQAPVTTQFLEAVVQHMDSTADATRFAALAAISTFASSSLDALCFVAGTGSGAVGGTPETVFAVPSAAEGSGGSSVLEAWTEMLRLKMDVQAAVLCSMAQVLLATDNLCHNEHDHARHAQAMLVILRRVGEVKNTLTMSFVLSLAKQPVLAGKFAAFEFYRSLASLKKGWGLDLIFGHAEVVEYLTEQGSESTYEGKERKYAVIEAVVAHESFALLSDGVAAKIRQVKEQGPHYIPARMREMETI